MIRVDVEFLQLQHPRQQHATADPVQQQARPEHAAELSNPRTQPMLSFASSEDKLFLMFRYSILLFV